MDAILREPAISVDFHMEFAYHRVKNRLSTCMKGMWDEAVATISADRIEARGERARSVELNYLDIKASMLEFILRDPTPTARSCTTMRRRCSVWA